MVFPLLGAKLERVMQANRGLKVYTPASLNSAPFSVFTVRSQ